MVARDIQRREGAVEYQGSLREFEQICLHLYIYLTLLPPYGWPPIPGARKTEFHLHPGANLLRDVMGRVPIAGIGNGGGLGTPSRASAMGGKLSSVPYL